MNVDNIDNNDDINSDGKCSNSPIGDRGSAMVLAGRLVDAYMNSPGDLVQ